uniref:Uncharacterized protein n=1 Tax=Sphaerodactylus townsendi TaxID=933632 RepID=A0ACB8FN04_9SAUR
MFLMTKLHADLLMIPGSQCRMAPSYTAQEHGAAVVIYAVACLFPISVLFQLLEGAVLMSTVDLTFSVVWKGATLPIAEDHVRKERWTGSVLSSKPTGLVWQEMEQIKLRGNTDLPDLASSQFKAQHLKCTPLSLFLCQKDQQCFCWMSK